ncbi:hypothetical protein [Mariniphaga sediminis]|uniref:hypothetical protein n=1 Tax=Mariniphaga sediminis TaxID=1628158 RepID=UPI0011C39ECB|nr:hypothetical protein [Mariniphaga sediminis]
MTVITYKKKQKITNMKTHQIILLLAFTIFGCNKDNFTINSEASVESLTMYWDHEVFGEGGKRLRFELYENKEFENSFKLVFDYKIEGKNITIILADKVDNGKCGKFPTPNGIDSLCRPKGNLFIPDNLLDERDYSVILKTYDFEIISNLTVHEDKYDLQIPTNENFSSSIATVYPIPENLLFGSVVFAGTENTQQAIAFLEELEAIGFVKTSVPNYPYRHLSVGENGKPIDTHWDPDNHNMRLLLQMDSDFEKAFDLAKKHFSQANLNIYLYSSNGDQARLSKTDGIIVEYAE